MRYTYEFKLECIDLYHQGRCPQIPIGIKEKRFHNMIREWVRIEDNCGIDALRHKTANKNWAPEEKYELVVKVLAGASNPDTVPRAGISRGMLYQWVQKYKAEGYNGLANTKRGRLPKSLL